MLQEKIRTDLKEAMKNKDSFKVMVLRGILAGFTNEIINQKRKPQEEISDEDAINVIKKGAKQRKDSIEQFTKGNRDDLVQNEKKELEILEKYLPAMMGPDEILKIANAKKTELKIDDSSKIGILIGAVLKEIKAVGASADGNEVKLVVEKLFSQPSSS